MKTDDTDNDAISHGWDAINAALRPIYGEKEPKHYGTLISYRLGGGDPLDGISAYSRDKPFPHWHFVTFGFTELYTKEWDDKEINGFGFELTFRLLRGNEQEPPAWVLSFLQNLARYVFNSGNGFEAGHYLDCNGPIALETETAIRAVLFAPDPELSTITSQYGKAQFLQIVGVTSDELLAVKRWSSDGMLASLRDQLPLLCTDLARATILSDPSTQARIERGVADDGSSTGSLFVTELAFDIRRRIFGGEKATISIGANQAPDLAQILPGRLHHGRRFALIGSGVCIELVPAERCGFTKTDKTLNLSFTPQATREFVAALAPKAQTIQLPSFPNLEIIIVKTEIKDQDGKITKVIG